MFFSIFNSPYKSGFNSEDPLDAFKEEFGALKRENEYLRARVSDLEKRLNANSSNSNTPSGCEPPYNKTSKERKIDDKGSKKTNGGQSGHKGSTLKQVDNPDKVIKYTVEICSCCGVDLSYTSIDHTIRRQVFDIEIKRNIIEHQTETKSCPSCSKKTKSAFPKNVNSPVQYGSQTISFASYLNQYQLIPLKRTSELFSDIFDLPLSEGTILSSSRTLASKLSPFKEWVKKQLMANEILHFDETSLRVGKKLHWLFVASTSELTYYFAAAKRSYKSFCAEGFDQYSGIAIHDHYAMYFKMPYATHSLCNPHIVRELKGIYESPDSEEDWPKAMYELLYDALQQVHNSKRSDSLYLYEISSIKRRYDKIISEGLKYHQLLPPLPLPPGTKNKGKKKQRTGKNLLERLLKHKEDVLRFISDFRVPFSNNQPERDLRMEKVRQKISGCFRTTKGVEEFAINRSYISTVKKQKMNILTEIQNAIQGKIGCLGS